ncbi:universal stress protein [Nonomuraea sp. NPDC050556]|uniref:universal stress protein n=1 Tax=Nonomuraea sp. NPDC050556 TaxID=3364369 RepID=UPI00379FDA53
MFTRIVVAYDHSPGARRALAEALTLGDRAELIAVAVQEHLPNYSGVLGEDHHFEDQACQRWLRAAVASAGEHDIGLITEARTGHVAQELIRAVEEREADLIVLGHNGHSATWGQFLGTTTEKVSRHVQCSVLIVR